ncbi:MAG: sigma-54 dependent transcriptional regulator [Pseudomonadota bacterium]|nr:sigma-54 dependent transcriptional regulator [Pseudomonadota bacterium]
MRERVLLVEDRAHLRALLARTLGAAFDVDEAPDGAHALTLLAATDYAVVVSDVRLPDIGGEAVLAAARAKDPAPEVVLMTAFAEVPAAVAALRAGAYDYLAKPFEPADLLRVVERAAERWALVGRARLLEAALDAQSGLLGASAAMVAVRRLAERVGPLPVTVLLTGESGTGKEVVARELHRLSGRARFVAVNCGAIPENLLEPELFGVAKGAYTGATADRKGLFEEAHGGTLFLDEIGDLPLPLQVKLNRALEEGEVRRVGETRARTVDVRLLTATHRDLEAMVAEGTFRADLTYRLRVMRIHLPPLRDRVEDIPLLAARFLQVAAARYRGRPLRLDPDALAALERAPWPGNVRELKHALEHAAVLAGDDLVTVADLPDELRATAPDAGAGTYRDAVERARDRAGRDYLVALLRRAGGNVTKAADEAGVERETLHRLLRRHGVEAGRFRE